MTTTRSSPAPHPGPLPARRESEKIRRRWPAAVLGATFLFVAAGLSADTAAEAAPPGKVNINQASAAQIASLPRTGEKVAVRVREDRKSLGPCARTEDLMEGRGSAERLFLTLKPNPAVSGPTARAANARSGAPRRRGALAPANKPAQKT